MYYFTGTDCGCAQSRFASSMSTARCAMKPRRPRNLSTICYRRTVEYPGGHYYNQESHSSAALWWVQAKLNFIRILASTLTPHTIK